jgi:hypothetical protein
VSYVIAEDFLLDLPKRGADGRNLRHHVDAVAILVHHLGQSADLTFDPSKPLLA